MKILYISARHSTQEWDDLNILTELNQDWFSTFFYSHPKNPLLYRGALMRPPIEKEVNFSWYAQYKLLNPHLTFSSKLTLSQAFINNFDLVFCNYSSPHPKTLQKILPLLKNKPLIYRTYGHQSPDIERLLKEAKKTHKLFIIRNSPKEAQIKDYAGHSDIIRGYVDEDSYKDWTGNISKVLTFANDFNVRMFHSYYDGYRLYLSQIAKELQCDLYGSGNDHLAGAEAPVSWESQLELYKKYAVYFSLNSPPANFPYSFIEALMTGIPVVAIGPTLGNIPDINNYELPDIIENGVSGFFSDSPDELISYLKAIIQNPKLGKSIGIEGRKVALKYFSKKQALEKWSNMLKEIEQQL